MTIQYLDLEDTSEEFLALLTIVKNLGSIATKDFWKGTQSEYDALESYDNNTLYFIEDVLSS